jgi:uncharacterized membrane protein
MKFWKKRSDFGFCLGKEALPSSFFPRLFAFYSFLSAILLIFVVPPFQHPEELNHFLRASQLASGGLIGRRFLHSPSNGPAYFTSGGKVDPVSIQAAWPFAPLVFHPHVQAEIAMWSPPRHWSKVRELRQFPNTVVYPPVFYLPAAAAIIVGRAMDITVLHTLLLGRFLTALAVIAIGTLAVVLAEGAAPWVFTVLLLPMSLDIAVSVSQDGLMLACSALAGALLLRALGSGGPPARTACVTAAAFLSLVAMSRPPYFALALLPLLVTAVPRRTRLAATTISASAVLAWFALTSVTDFTNPGAFLGADSAAQAKFLWQHIFAFPAILWRTLYDGWLSLLQQFLGRLGWDDTPLPQSYYFGALTVLGLAACASLTARRFTPMLASVRVAILTACLIAAAGVFLSLYVAWTMPGSPKVGGVEGRYFLPIAVAGSALLRPAAFILPPWLRYTRKMSLAVIATFPVVTVGVVLRTLALRYGVADW